MASMREWLNTYTNTQSSDETPCKECMEVVRGRNLHDNAYDENGRDHEYGASSSKVICSGYTQEGPGKAAGGKEGDNNGLSV